MASLCRLNCSLEFFLIYRFFIFTNHIENTVHISNRSLFCYANAKCFYKISLPLLVDCHSIFWLCHNVAIQRFHHDNLYIKQSTMFTSSINNRKSRINSMIINHKPSHWNLYSTNFISWFSFISSYWCSIINNMNKKISSI